MSDKSIKMAFEKFAKDGKISHTGIKEWFKEASIIGKQTGLTEADVEAAISETSEDKKGLDFDELKECINILGNENKIEPEELMEKLERSGVKCSKQTPLDVVTEDEMEAKVAKDEKEK